MTHHTDWNTYIQKYGVKEAVAVVFRRLMPVINLDEDPPVKYIRTNDKLDLSGSEQDINDIMKQERLRLLEEVEKEVQQIEDYSVGDVVGSEYWSEGRFSTCRHIRSALQTMKKGEK